MAIYKLDAIINSREVKQKSFKTRNAADRYLVKLLDAYNLTVNDVVYRNNNHYQEFICDDYNRISINRTIVNF